MKPQRKATTKSANVKKLAPKKLNADKFTWQKGDIQSK